MKTIKINFKKGDIPEYRLKKRIDLIVKYLKQGKAIAYPTDTVYGLGCRADNSRAVYKIHKIKKQKVKITKKEEDKKSFLVLVDSYEMLKKYCKVSRVQLKYLTRIWPGPVTVVLILKKGKLPGNLTGGTDTLAVRLPKSRYLIKIIKKVGVPIVSTSLNISGKTTLNNVKDISKYLKKVKPDLVIDGGKIKRIKPSKLVDIRDIKNIKILRK